MNANLTNARKVYFDKVHRIQRDRNCTFTEAKKLYSAANNGAISEDSLDDLTPEQLAAKAQQMAQRLETKVADTLLLLKTLEDDLRRWQILGRALDSSDAFAPDVGPGDTQEVRQSLGPPPNPPKAAYPHKVG